ncbi:MAG: hypothetical protein LW875_10860 [Proteobacteria bacterium]|jgi:hypothetical protein|nr:hypothetical protein [Pseudomonadota bacterium]
MDFKNRIKGTVTQALVQALLHDVQNRVVPLGIEEVIRELNALTPDQYLKLDLPQTLRRLPDFFVTSVNQEQGWLLEVKYRERWNDDVRADLGKRLFDQVKLWSPLYLVLFVGEAVRKNDTPASYLGVCKLIIENETLGTVRKKRIGNLLSGHYEDEFVQWDSLTWDNFKRFQDIFPGISDAWEKETLIKTVTMMKGLYDL